MSASARRPRAGRGALGIAWHPYQLAWLNDLSRFKIGMWSRQVGKTFCTTFEIAEDMVAARIEGRPAPWVMLSRGERQSASNLRQLRRHLKGMGEAFEELESDFKVDDETVYRRLEIRMSDEVWVAALPANPDTARGESANIYLDEFAIHRDSREIWGALFPIVSAGWKLRITSTPKGKQNKFYELMTAEETDFSRHVVDIHRAVADGLPRDIEVLRRNLGDEDLWRQEFECEWLDEASAWLPQDLILAVEDERAGEPAGYAGGACYIGNDIAARNDLWVAWVIEEVGDVFWTREVRVLKRASFAEQDAVLDELVARYRVARVCMDQTGMGEKPVEDAKRRYGSSRVEGVLFTPGNKLVLATAGKQVFEDRRIRIPEGDIKMRADLNKLKRVDGPTGAPRFVAEADSAGHADYAWACFLAVNAATDTAAAYGYEAATPARGRFDEAPGEDSAEGGGRMRFGRGAW